MLVSGFVALTLTPMMCSKLLRRRHSTTRRIALSSAASALTAGYERGLRASLSARPLVLLVGILVAGSSVFFFLRLDAELAPTEDQGTIVGNFQGPQGATIEYTDKYARELEKLYAEVPEVERYFMIVGNPTVSTGRSFIKLKPWDERERSQQEIAAELRPKMEDVPGVMAFPSSPQSLGGGSGDQAIQFVVQTSRPYAELRVMVEELTARLAQHPAFVNLDTDLKLNQPQLKVTVNRDKVADVGVSIDVLGRTLETLLGGRQVTRFERDGEQYEVMVQLADVDRNNPGDLRRIYVRGQGGQMVQLSNLVESEETVAPQELNHFDRLRAATITASLAEGASLGDALVFLENTAEEVLPATARTDYRGQSREFKESSAGIYLTFLLALAFIYIGAGAESRQDIGLVIVGGLLVGTFFTLFVIPVVYTYVARGAVVHPGSDC